MIKRYIQYLKDNPEGYWFKRKVYGWGWTPARWQGWATLLVYIAIFVKIFLKIDKGSHSGSDTLISVALPFLLLTALLIIVCYKTGEKPGWQWGLPTKDSNQNPEQQR